MAEASYLRSGQSLMVFFRRRAIKLVAIGCLGVSCLGQSSSSGSEDSGVLRGVVVNSVTHEPVDRALVSSPDHRFATMTDSEGRFEFAITKTEFSSNDSGSDRPDGPRRAAASNRPYSLVARKPGFLSDPNQQGNYPRNSREVTLTLTPEAVISGTVALPTSEAPDSITLQLFRRQIQDGRGHWIPAGGSRTMSDGQFRFANLQAGTYKLLTTELLDSDPLTSDPRAGVEARGPLFGYPPVFYQSATDFPSANPIQVAAGQTQTVEISLVKQSYYRVKLPVAVPADGSANGFNVAVYAGRKGPGFSLGYN